MAYWEVGGKRDVYHVVAHSRLGFDPGDLSRGCNISDEHVGNAYGNRQQVRYHINRDVKCKSFELWTERHIHSQCDLGRRESRRNGDLQEWKRYIRNTESKWRDGVSRDLWAHSGNTQHYGGV
jgi:hypothetical protein